MQRNDISLTEANTSVLQERQLNNDISIKIMCLMAGGSNLYLNREFLRLVLDSLKYVFKPRVIRIPFRDLAMINKGNAYSNNK